MALFNRITERAQAPARDVNGSPPTSRPRIDGSPASPARDLSRLNPDGSQLFVKEEDEEGESESDKAEPEAQQPEGCEEEEEENHHQRK